MPHPKNVENFVKRRTTGVESETVDYAFAHDTADRKAISVLMEIEIEEQPGEAGELKIRERARVTIERSAIGGRRPVVQDLIWRSKDNDPQNFEEAFSHNGEILEEWKYDVVAVFVRRVTVSEGAAS